MDKTDKIDTYRKLDEIYGVDAAKYYPENLAGELPPGGPRRNRGMEEGRLKIGRFIGGLGVMIITLFSVFIPVTIADHANPGMGTHALQHIMLFIVFWLLIGMFFGAEIKMERFKFRRE